MDPNQTKIIELLREVHLLAIKEIERLNMRIAELENENRQPAPVPTVSISPPVAPAPINPPSHTKQPEMMNEKQVSAYLNISLGTLRKWRLFRKGPKYLKIGSAVRYRRADVETWLNSCPGLR